MDQYQACAHKPWRRDQPFRFDAAFLGTMDNLVIYSDRVGRLRVPAEFRRSPGVLQGNTPFWCDLEAEGQLGIDC